MLKAEFEQIGPVQSILDFDPNEEPPALACFKNTRQIVELTTDSPQQGQHIGAYVRAIRAGLAKHYDYCVIDTAPAWDGRTLDRKRVGEGKSVSGRVDDGGRRRSKKKKQ